MKYGCKALGISQSSRKVEKPYLMKEELMENMVAHKN